MLPSPRAFTSKVALGTLAFVGCCFVVRVVAVARSLGSRGLLSAFSLSALRLPHHSLICPRSSPCVCRRALRAPSFCSSNRQNVSVCARRHNIPTQPPPSTLRSHRHVLHVRTPRAPPEALLDRTMTILASSSTAGLGGSTVARELAACTSLHVSFDGEEGIDAGGLTRDWFRVVGEAFRRRTMGILQQCSDGRRVTVHRRPLSSSPSSSSSLLSSPPPSPPPPPFTAANERPFFFWVPDCFVPTHKNNCAIEAPRPPGRTQQQRVKKRVVRQDLLQQSINNPPLQRC